jgi:hypothetical protein
MTTLNQQEAAKASVALMGHVKVCIFCERRDGANNAWEFTKTGYPVRGPNPLPCGYPTDQKELRPQSPSVEKGRRYKTRPHRPGYAARDP